MRATITCLGLFLVVSHACPTHAEEGSPGEIPEFNKLRTPDSPAFVLLGVSPSEIQQPSSVKPFAASMMQAFTESGDLVIPKNFAMEVSPYWLFPNPDLSMKEYRGDG